jgi:D-3-phosphoglycerate dehydrogenase
MELRELLTWADLVCLHAATTKGSAPLLDAEAISCMKPGSRLINAARGNLVDENALAEALHSGHLSGAALDVFSREPYQGPLTQIPGVILTPHIGSYAQEARVRMELDTIRNLLDALAKESLLRQ